MRIILRQRRRNQSILAVGLEKDIYTVQPRVLSWKDKHRKIHEEELLQFLAPNKKGKVFEPQPKEQSEKLPVSSKGCNESVISLSS